MGHEECWTCGGCPGVTGGTGLAERRYDYDGFGGGVGEGCGEGVGHVGFGCWIAFDDVDLRALCGGERSQVFIETVWLAGYGCYGVASG